MAPRYLPWQTPNGTWGLIDWRQMEFCTLPHTVRVKGKEKTTHIPLAWNSRAGAEAWLQQCYQTWARWERDGAGQVPTGWRPRRRDPSPYANGLPFPRE